MKSIKFIGVECDKCKCYYITIAKSHTCKCPSCGHDLELYVCDKEDCTGCDKSNICPEYRSDMEDISGL